jgi:chromosome condensin MukBEF MukE localization factor
MGQQEMETSSSTFEELFVVAKEERHLKTTSNRGTGT